MIEKNWNQVKEFSKVSECLVEVQGGLWTFRRCEWIEISKEEKLEMKWDKFKKFLESSKDSKKYKGKKYF